MNLITWSWIFLCVYIALMLGIGILGSRKVRNADDFATARSGYGPVFLAFAFAATTASGATFLGGPGLVYELGLANVWAGFLYPIGVYFGVLISMRLIATAGNRFGCRSIAEYLGQRYQSEGIRVMVSVFSLVLFFYLAGQLVSGLVMFETMLGLKPMWALTITTVVLLFYVVMGGAHADILTDGIQGVMMLLVAVTVILLVAFGVGIEGGFSGLWNNLAAQDPILAEPVNPGSALTHSWWSITSILFACIPLGLLPHLGNKLWALRDLNQQKTFLKLAFTFGLTLGMMGVGGLLARALLGGALLEEGATTNQALPLVFIEIFPTWLAALIGMGVLAAIMSTADGLVVSSSQIVANDLYRLTIAPRLRNPPTGARLDRQVLNISRVTTVIVLLLTMVMAWGLMDTNIALIIWIGTGGLMAAFAGPLVMGALWRGVTRQGAYAGLASGFIVFVILHSQLLEPGWFGSSGILYDLVSWVHGEGPNPFSCAAMGEAVSISLTFLVSRFTQPLPEDHIRGMFGSAGE